jgi:hypothetical protein
VIAAGVRASDRAGIGEALCSASITVVAADGAALTMRGSSLQFEEMVSATDQWTAALEEAQYTLGEGPGVEAFATGAPVLVDDIEADGRHWPGFAKAAKAAGAAAVFAFPLHLGGMRLGTLDLYGRRPGGLAAEELGDAAVLADLATLALIEHAERIGQQSNDDESSYQDVHVATGMLAVLLDVGLDEAFLRLRAYAFTENRLVVGVARDVLARRIGPDQLGG